MNKLKVVEMAIDEVIPYENNPRFNDEAVDPVAESIFCMAKTKQTEG